MVWIYKPRFENQTPDLNRCRASVSSGDTFFRPQCSRKGVVEREHNGETMLFCRTHDPEAAKERMEKQSKLWQTRWANNAAASAYNAAINKYNQECANLIDEIARRVYDPEIAIEVAQEQLETKLKITTKGTEHEGDSD
jgi:hypothetical protein